jgi:two-component system, NtrC family, response regulator AtoC
VVTHSVLIVDDEAILAKNIRGYLEYHKYSVCVVGTSGEGLKRFKEWHPDVVLLDIYLPDGNGFEVVRRIREIDAKVGVIMWTAFGGVQRAVAAMAAGADNYVEKPVPLKSLKLMIERIIESQRPAAETLLH